MVRLPVEFLQAQMDLRKVFARIFKKAGLPERSLLHAYVGKISFTHETQASCKAESPF
jgi:hypothetical protein